MNERTLHVALRTPFEGQPALARALQSISDVYHELDWQADPARATTLLHKAHDIRPTLVFMQLQSKDAFSPKDIGLLRPFCDEHAVIVSWDGDLRGEPHEPSRRWFVEMGKAVDLSLVTNTAHVHGYRAEGILADYLQIGIDETIYRQVPPTPGTPEIVFLGGRYPSHDRRNRLIDALIKRYGARMGVYGPGWEGRPSGHPILRQDEEAGVYAAARGAISMSIRNDLAAYTSDRLFRAMASGAVCLVEDFPGGLGMTSGVFLWRTEAFLFEMIDDLLEGESPDGRDAAAMRDMRLHASRYAHRTHSWAARMPVLRDRVAGVRAAR